MQITKAQISNCFRIFIIFILTSASAVQAQWYNQQVPGDIGILLSIDFTNSNSGVSTGWILNNEATGRAIYTSNGGNNWLLASVPDSTRSLVTVQMINAAIGYTAGAYDILSMKTPFRISSSFQYSKRNPIIVNMIGKSDSILGTRAFFLKTTNSGHSWFPYGSFPANSSYLIGMYFINETTGFVSAERFQNYTMAQGIYKTTNGGLNWALSYSVSDTVNIRNIFFVDGNTGFGIGYDITNDPVYAIQGLILKTTNGGNNWSKQMFYNVNNFTDVSFVNNLTGFACGVSNSMDIYKGIIYKTTNSGQNWFKLSYQSDTTMFEGIVFYPSTGIGIVYGIECREDTLYPGVYDYEHLIIAKTTNYGSTWQPYQIDNTEYIYIGNKMIDQNNWYITGGNAFNTAKIQHTTNGGQIGINPISSEIPNDFNLYQNYPNPFNPETKIRFDVPKADFVTINIFDILGREVSTIVNEQLQPGTYEVEWDAANYPSGIYINKLISGNYSLTRKMVLIK